MRIGEIAIVGAGILPKQQFIKAVCNEIVVENDDFLFGRLQINEQLVIHLYGLEFSDKEIKPSLDLVSKKLLGYVFLFEWGSQDSYSEVVSTIDSLTSRYKLPLVIAANLQNGSTGIPSQMLNVDFDISSDDQFTFCKLSDPESVRNVLVMLINLVIDKVN